MNKSKMIVLAATACAAQWLTLTTAHADELYRAIVSAMRVETNSAGGLSYQLYGNSQIIRECALAQGLTNLSGLKLVYDRTADALEVVSNTTVICTPLTFHGGVSLSKTNDTVTERLTFVFLDSNQEANGTLRARESSYSFTFGTNHITRYSLTGQLQFAAPASGTNPAKIYSGSIFAGSFFWAEPDAIGNTPPEAAPEAQ